MITNAEAMLNKAALFAALRLLPKQYTQLVNMDDREFELYTRRVSPVIIRDLKEIKRALSGGASWQQVAR